MSYLGTCTFTDILNVFMYVLSNSNTPRLYTKVLQKVLSLGSDYLNATFYQTYCFTEKHFCNLFTQSQKADK